MHTNYSSIMFSITIRMRRRDDERAYVPACPHDAALDDNMSS
jgi:hypothetical protein